MAYFIWYSTHKHEPKSLDVVHSEEAALSFLDGHAGNEDFTFLVVRGDKLEYEPLTVATKYVRKY